MARGKSGRLVLEVDPVLKRHLYFSLEKNQKTLREWFIENAEKYISKENVVELIVTEKKHTYNGKNK